MATFRSVLDRIKSEIEEVDAAEAKRRLDDGWRAIDVREPSETSDGHVDGATLIPRGLLELRIEEAAPDRDAPLLVYCAGGTRSALAVASLTQLGYTRLASLDTGFGGWKQAGFGFTVPISLTPEQESRYSRHLLIPEVGEAGQRRLLDAKVLMLGAGGLGSPAAYYLAAAGVGTLGIIDSDVVDRSNLQRQILHTDDRVGVPKVESARQTLTALNPDVNIVAYDTRLTVDNVMEIFEGYDIVVDGGDNFPTRYLVNDACVHLGIPNVTGSVYRFEGQVTVVKPKEGPCYRCLYPEPPPPEFAPSCQEAGVLGVVPGTIGLLQATEVVKLILGVGEPLVGRLLMYDALDQRFRELKIRRDPGCKMCGDDAKFEGFVEYAEFCKV
ncbi:MAG: molybdopterin/thiamine biosynthesis adenylyltransferase/rhodanese-related sulfurtransferase [Bradymonadia bacterium]|jgi:molybdopterin/thiamine biosynthesis adenylyltransferase/rhodanese-related sulfurtransferase